MDVYTLQALVDRQAASGGPYLEFLRVPDLSLGLYVLEAGARGPPAAAHRGRGLRGPRRPRRGSPPARRRARSDTGDTIFVAAGVPHRFHDIAETLRLVVVFGPAEGSRGAG